MMKRHRFLAGTGVLSISLMFFGPFTRAQAPDPKGKEVGMHNGRVDADKVAVRDLFTRMLDTYKRGDAHGVAALFTNDGVMITGGGDQLASPVQIEKFLADLVAKLPKGTTFTSEVASVRFAGKDVAILTSGGGWLYPGENAVSDKNRGLQTMVAQRQNGVWRALLFQRTRMATPAK
jgi:uncharacterized protein (TIGR02246 family)